MQIQANINVLENHVVTVKDHVVMIVVNSLKLVIVKIKIVVNANLKTEKQMHVQIAY